MASPFGMLFEEAISTSLPLIQPQYDPVDQISFCYNDLGQKVPFVIYECAVIGATSTFTKEKYEGTDTDPDIPPPRH